MNHLSAEFVEERKQALLEQKEELTQLISTVADPDTGDHVPGDFAPKFENYGDDNPGDAGSDSPDEVQNYEQNAAVTGEVAEHLAQVEAALKRIEEGTYGVDLESGDEISEERLVANPAATTAIK